MPDIRARLKFKSGFFPYYNTAWFMAGLTLACYALSPYLGYHAVGSIFLLGILVVAGFAGTGPILMAAVASALAWDYLLIPPRFTFAVTSSDDVMMLISFFVTALVAGFLTTRIRNQEEVLLVRAGRARAQFELARRLSEAPDERHIADAFELTINSQLPVQSMATFATPENALASPLLFPIAASDQAVAQSAFHSGLVTGWATDVLAEASVRAYPMNGKSERVGVLLVYPKDKSQPFNDEQLSFLQTVINQAAVALERFRFSKTAEATKLYQASEKLHQTLLSSISHEMRTPLTVIMGSATALNDRTLHKSPESTRILADELIQASERLNRVVENLLDMNRLSSGVLALNLDWHDMQDVLSTTVAKLGRSLANHPVKADFPALPMVSLDFRLFEHALSNLILNAAHYSPPGAPISVTAQTCDDGSMLELAVIDRGPGIPESAREKIFEKFYRIPGNGAGGVGLGLSIAKSIVEAHHGRIQVRASSEGGSVFAIFIPIAPAPDMPKDFD